MKTCNRSYERTVADIVSRHVAEVLVLEPVPTYPDSIVYRCVSPSRVLILKAHDPQGRDRDGIALEAWACESARSLGIPTPEVIEVDTSSERFPSSFFVMCAAEGTPVDERQQGEARTVVARRIGELMAQLHSATLPGFGWLDTEHYAETSEIRGEHSTWGDALTAGVEDALRHLCATLTGDEILRMEHAASDAMQHVADEVKASLLHGDLGGTHVFVDDQTLDVTALIDWGERSSGPWEWDFLEWDPTWLDDLLDGYGFVEDRAELRHRLTRLSLLKSLPWAAKWHERGEEAVVGWLRRVLEACESIP